MSAAGFRRVEQRASQLVLPSIDRIIEQVAEAFGVTYRDILSDRRDARLVVARHAGIWLARRLTLHSYPVIGRSFGRDHTTVMYAVSRIEQRMADDGRLVRRLGKLEQELIRWQ